MVDTRVSRRQRVIDSILPPDHPLLAPNLPSITYNPQAGMALLDEIGWIDDGWQPQSTPRMAQDVTGVPNGTPLTFYLRDDQCHPTGAGNANPVRKPEPNAALGSMSTTCPPANSLQIGPDGRLLGRQFDLGQFAWQVIIRRLAVNFT